MAKRRLLRETEFRVKNKNFNSFLLRFAQLFLVKFQASCSLYVFFQKSIPDCSSNTSAKQNRASSFKNRSKNKRLFHRQNFRSNSSSKRVRNIIGANRKGEHEGEGESHKENPARRLEPFFSQLSRRSGTFLKWSNQLFDDSDC